MLTSFHFGNTKNLLEPNPEILLLVNDLGNDRKALFFYNVAKDTFVGKCFFQINGDVVGVWQSKLIIIQSDLTKRKVCINYSLNKIILNYYNLGNHLRSAKKGDRDYRKL